MQVLRNVFRRKLRVFLTISGITIGVLALVVMGSMAEKINLLVSGGTRYYSDKVTVSAEVRAPCSPPARSP
jgi:ABC-type antimicrobial peptide transport system permease subunit